MINYKSFIGLLSQAVWPLMRLSGLMLTAPVFSSHLIPPRVRVMLLFTMAIVCAPFAPSQLILTNFNPMYLIIGLQELMLGLLMGFVLLLVFQVFILAGQLLSMQAGLGFATMVDPASRASVPLIGQFYLLLVTLLFLAFDGHLAVLEMLMGSFKTQPIGEMHLSLSMLWSVIAFSGWMFNASLLVALPAILALLLVNLSFGVMARIAPQLNIFSMGFSISLMMGFIVLVMSLSEVSSSFEDSLAHGLLFIKGMMH